MVESPITDMPTKLKSEILVNCIAAIMRPLMLRTHAKDCCIATTRAVTRLLGLRCVKARPMVVTVAIWNRAGRETMERFQRYPESEAEAQEWFERYGAVGIGIGAEQSPSPDHWHAHLVAIVDDHTLLDCSIDQANRPQWNIMLPPGIVAPVTPGFLAGDEILSGLVGEGPHECLITYKAHPADQSYATTPAWLNLFQVEPIVGHAMEIIELAERDGELPFTVLDRRVLAMLR